jgi:hypothetical protein
MLSNIIRPSISRPSKFYGFFRLSRQILYAALPSLTMSMHPISFLLIRSPRCLISSTDNEAAPYAVFTAPLLSLLSQIIDNKIRKIKNQN